MFNITVNVLSSVFKSSLDCSTKLLEAGIDSLKKKEKNDITRVIIHRGLDRYLLYNKNIDKIFNDLTNVLDTIKKFDDIKR